VGKRTPRVARLLIDRISEEFCACCEKFEKFWKFEEFDGFWLKLEKLEEWAWVWRGFGRDKGED